MNTTVKQKESETIEIGQRIKITRMGGGISYGIVTGKSTSIFSDEPIFIITIDGLQNEYAVAADEIMIIKTRRKGNVQSQ